MMRIQSKIIKLGALVMAAAVLVACQPDVKIDPRAGGGGLNGNWASSDGIFTAKFDGGLFTATANDTGEVISTGSYIAVSSTQVNLNWKGNVTRRDNSATCQRPDVKVLNCTDAAGKTFRLNKLG